MNEPRLTSVTTEPASRSKGSTWLAFGCVAAVLVGVVGLALAGRADGPARASLLSPSLDSPAAAGTAGPAQATRASAPPSKASAGSSHATPGLAGSLLPVHRGGLIGASPVHAVLRIGTGRPTPIPMAAQAERPESSGYVPLARRARATAATLRLTLADGKTLVDASRLRLPPSLPIPDGYACVVVARKYLAVPGSAKPSPGVVPDRYLYTVALVLFRESSVLSVRLVPGGPGRTGATPPPADPVTCV